MQTICSVRGGSFQALFKRSESRHDPATDVRSVGPNNREPEHFLFILHAATSDEEQHAD
jgi:hypothetical protein